MMRRCRLPIPILLGMLCLPSLTGCGAGGVTSEGTVTFRNQPLPGAEVEMKLEGGTPENLYTGITDAQGKFTVRSPTGGGIPPGNYEIKVLFWANRKGELPPLTEQAEVQKQQGLYPQWYGVVKKEVTAESSEIVIALTPEELTMVEPEIE